MKITRPLVLTLLALMLPAPMPVGAAAPTTGRARAIAVDARGASLADVLDRLSTATGVRMAASGAVGDQRVTLHAARTTAGDLQAALCDLLRLEVRESGAETAPRTTLAETAHLAAQVRDRRLDQAHAFLDAVLHTAGDFQAGREAESVRALRDRFQRAHPEFSDAMLAPVTADYLRSSLLLTALSPSLRAALAQAGEVSLPVASLTPAAQSLAAAFAQSGSGAGALEGGAADAGAPEARAQFRLLYGDRWTGPMLLMQVGTPGAWTSATLPSILFQEQDDAALYPDAATPADDADVWRRLPPHFDLAGKSWDSVLDELAKTMDIKLAADSYARPWLFHADQPLPKVAGIPLREALDRLCRQHGYFWWKQDGWYLLRSRQWTEESRVAVPDRLLRGWVKSIQEHGALTEADLLQLGDLSGDQLLTLNLQSRPAGSAALLGAGFDPNAAELLATGLLLFRGLPAAARQRALGDGLPALWMPAAPQSLFTAVAAEHGAARLPVNEDLWRFRVRQSFDGASHAAAHRVSGELRVEWSFGAGEPDTAAIALSDRALHPTVDPVNPSDVR